MGDTLPPALAYVKGSFIAQADLFFLSDPTPTAPLFLQFSHIPHVLVKPIIMEAPKLYDTTKAVTRCDM